MYDWWYFLFSQCRKLHENNKTVAELVGLSVFSGLNVWLVANYVTSLSAIASIKAIED